MLSTLPGSRLQDAAMEPRLRIYTDLSGAGFYRPSMMVLPWIPGGIDSKLLGSYTNDHAGIELASLRDCHFAVLPFDAACLLRQPYGPANSAAIDFARTFASRARAASKPTIAVVAGDTSNALPVKFDVVLRHSIDRRRRQRGEYCLPGWFDAAQNADPEFAPLPRPAGDRPVVGFCGQAGLGTRSIKQHVRDCYNAVRRPAGTGHDRVNPLAMRKSVLDALAASSQVDCNFVVRDKFFAELQDPETARSAYVANIQESDFVLCMRGFGNYSFRLYDTLSMGRVPIIIDTDCVHPFDHALNLTAQFPIVSFRRLNQLAPAIANYFNNVYRASWRQTQGRMRRLYLEWFAPIAFFRRLPMIPEIAEVLRSTP